MAIVIVRTLIVYFALVLFMRLMGKRQLGELELPELAVAVLIADLAAHPLQDIGIPLMNGLLPVVVLFCCEVLIAGATMKSSRLRSLLYGRPAFLISKGVIDQGEMRRSRFTLDELTEELRGKGITDIAQVEYAVLETNGVLNTLLFPEFQPALRPRPRACSPPAAATPWCSSTTAASSSTTCATWAATAAGC